MAEPVFGPYVVLVVPERHIQVTRGMPGQLPEIDPADPGPDHQGLPIPFAAMATFETSRQHGQLNVSFWALCETDRRMVCDRLRALADFIERAGA
jgi:hypothetical protein